MQVLKLETLNSKQRATILNRPSPLDDVVKEKASAILDKVSEQGDAALKEFSRLFDQVRLEQLQVPTSTFQQAFDRIDDDVRAALGQAKLQLEKFHEQQTPSDYEIEAGTGVTLGRVIRPYQRVGIYVPKNLVSSLLMAAVPARLAGACRLIVCTPPQADGTVPDVMLAAAELLDVEELYMVGGAQAIAAMAYGTASIEKTDKIVGPGNAYVTAAKALVRDEVSIDLLAGPSEVVIVVEPVDGFPTDQLTEWALSELRAQLEHGPGTSAVILTSIDELAERVSKAFSDEELDQRNVAILTYESLNAAIEFINDYAPEHLCLWGKTAEARLPAIQNAGSVFLGPWSPVAMGDYTSGTNHVLPTSRQARLTGGLSVRDFYKTISYQRLSPEGFSSLANTATTLAELEGMTAHAESVRTRLKGVSA
jgi:histidinol dehydrogenase